jgi:mannose-6-phosphate isomerase-like protein (cupin superfamily)
VDEPILVEPGGGEVVGDSPERRVEILSDREGLAATWTRFGPHQDGADLHVHREHTDLFYVLAGELTLRLGVEDRAVPVPAGTLARVPPGVVHGFRNAGADGLRYLNFHAPGVSFPDYLRAMRDGREFAYDQFAAPADGGRPTDEAVVGGGTIAGDGAGLRVTLLADVDAISVAETWGIGLASGPPEAHDRTASFYVLEGEVRFTAAGRQLRAVAGAWVQLPAGVPFSVEAPRRPVRFIEARTA